jgi:hypothetical protein
LEGCKPSKNHPFLVQVAGKSGNLHQKKLNNIPQTCAILSGDPNDG